MRFAVLSPDKGLVSSWTTPGDAIQHALELHAQTGLTHHVVAAMGHTSSQRVHGAIREGGDPVYVGARNLSTYGPASHLPSLPGGGKSA